MAAIIYANTMSFDGRCSIDKLLGVVAAWLNDSDKTNGRFDSIALKRKNTLSFPGWQQVQIWVSDDAYPHAHAVRYSHPNRDLFGRPMLGRKWITEVGFRREFEDGDIECTVLLRTEDDSPNSNVPEVSRPNLVRDLIKLCPLIPDVDGLSLTQLNIMDDGMMDGLRDFVIENAKRRRPLVIVSPTATGEYLVKEEKLSNLLAGLASVIVIPVGFDTWKVEEIVGNRYAAYNGAVNIVFPSREVRGSQVVPTKKLMPDELLDTPVGKRETAILAAVTRRTNSASYSRHISPESVNELDLRRRIAKRREEANEQGAQTRELDDLWAEYERLDRDKREVDAKLASSDDENVSLNLMLDQAQQEKSEQERYFNHQIKTLKESLATRGFNRVGDNDEAFPKFRDAFVKVIDKQAVPIDYVTVFSYLFSDRLVFLETAWTSAEDSANFQQPEELFDLLWKLSSPYWQALDEGRGDVEARHIFGNKAFSANESDKTLNNSNGRKYRLFEYEGKHLLMDRHLKIGNKHSDAVTFRIHFDWLAERRKIIIGHCGPHLDFK